MDIGDCLSISFKYPFKDFPNFKFVMLFFALLVPLFYSIWYNTSSDIIISISLILLLVVILIIPGYLISIVKNGILQTGEVSNFNVKKNIVDTFKLFLISLVYSIVPIIVMLIVSFSFGIFAYSEVDLASLSTAESNQLALGIIITVLIAILVEFVYVIFLIVAIARFAYHDSMSQAFEFGEVYRDIKKIGIGKLIGWLIVTNIIFNLIARFGLLLVLIPVAGVLIYLLVLLPFALLFYAYSIGCIYSNVLENE